MRRPSGQQAEAAPGNAETNAAETVVYCRNSADLYSKAGRQAIGRLLAKPLQAWELTPIELLYDLDSYRRLANTGSSLQNAVQRAAVAQVGQTGEPVGERMRVIFDIVDTAVRELHARSKSAPQALAKSSFEEAARKLEDSPEREFLLAMTLAGLLRQEKGAKRKLETLSQLLEQDLPPWSEKTLDRFLSEQLIEGGILQKRLPGDNLAQHLELCIRLSRGGLEKMKTADYPLLRVNRAIAKGRLSRTSAYIAEYVFAALGANRRATGGGLEGEFKALSSLLDVVCERHGGAGGHLELRQAFEERCARLLNPQSLSDYLARPGNLGDRADRLLDLADHAIGSRNLRTIGEQLIHLLDDPHGREFWSKPVGASLEQRMKTAARLQGRVLSGRMPESTRETLSGRLDRICVELLDRSKLLETIEAETSSVMEKCKRLLGLLAEGHVTEGVAARRVRASIQRCFSDPGFLASLAHTESDKTQKASMREFHQLLLKAGFAGENVTASSNDG